MVIDSKGIVAICVNDTPENQRWRTTVRCLTSFGITTDFSSHELIIIDNGSTCPNTKTFLEEFCQDLIGVRNQNVTLVRFGENQYATYVFNHVVQIFAQKFPQRVFVRVENDLEMVTSDWLVKFISMFIEYPAAGAISTKPHDLPAKGEGGVPVKLAGLDCLRVDEVPGYCTAFRPGIFNLLGTLVSAGNYIEDILTSVRLRKLGWELFLTQPDVVSCYHIDRCPTLQYSQWKKKTVISEWSMYLALREDYETGKRELFTPFVPDQVDVEYPYISINFEKCLS